MYFIAMLLTLRMDENVKLTVADGVYAHAAVLSAISTVEPQLGADLHNLRRNKRIAMALVKCQKQQAWLRLSFMDEHGGAAAEALAHGLARHPKLRIGRVNCTVTDISLSDSIWAGINTWADLTGASSSSYLHFSFVTPSAFTKHDGNNQRFMSLFPEPVDLFTGLARRWQSLSGPDLAAGLAFFLARGDCRVASHRLATVKFQTQERTQIGFVGQVVYECIGDEQCIAAVNCLARLAFFTGVGYQTARGMGAVLTRVGP